MVFLELPIFRFVCSYLDTIKTLSKAVPTEG